MTTGLNSTCPSPMQSQTQSHAAPVSAPAPVEPAPATIFIGTLRFNNACNFSPMTRPLHGAGFSAGIAVITNDKYVPTGMQLFLVPQNFSQSSRLPSSTPPRLRKRSVRTRRVCSEHAECADVTLCELYNAIQRSLSSD